MIRQEKVLLVGDNPFHGISHLSQERSRVRGDAPTDPEYAAKLIQISLDNGANGFMFSVSDKTLSILNILRNNGTLNSLGLYAIVPYAYEYVRLSGKVGGISGLAKKVVKEIALSGSFNAMATGLKGVLKTDLNSLVKTYLAYEISRIKSSAGKHAKLDSVLLHQLITDMCLGFGLDWVFRLYVDFMLKAGLEPGFNTGNLALLVKKFRELGINLEKVLIAAPLNKAGFQMVPTKKECENALTELPKPNVLAISILAAGYLKPLEAIDYIAGLPNIKGVAVGVSKETQACETFRLLKEKLVKA
ncbi:hypothetical protein HXY32_02380 [Candidatus Bathyarchaeota archaeon]|nr:hypothetical protein [Candidatus Bathyarchaeota archaeon]